MATKRELLNEVENYLLQRKRKIGNVPNVGKISVLDAECGNLMILLSKIDKDVITEMCEDLRDYWDTLEVGK